MEYVTCNKCGWVHMGVSREHAEDEVRRFNEYFDGLPVEKQEDYYGGKKSSVLNYEKCFRCGSNWENFRRSREGDCPDGCTIGPIIHFSAGIDQK